MKYFIPPAIVLLLNEVVFLSPKIEDAEYSELFAQM